MQIKKLVALSITIAVLGCFSSAAAKQRKVSNGSWGGDQITLTVDDNSARVEYGCATGTINGPLMVDSNGRFKWQGTHAAQHGGPIRADENSNGRPAVYSGTLKGRTMTLTVKLRDTNETIGTFNLVLGKDSKLVRCL